MGNPFTVDWLPRIDVLLPCAPRELWPWVLHTETWMPDLRSEHISGPESQIGEVRRVTKIGDAGQPVSRFVKKTVVLQPNERLVFKMLRFEEPIGGFDELVGYAIYNLHDLRHRTLLTYETVSQFTTSRMSPEQALEAVGPEAMASGRRHWEEVYVPKLNALLKGQRDG
jgi:hypothetical protein